MTNELSCKELIKIRDDFYDAENKKHEQGLRMLVLIAQGAILLCAGIILLYSTGDMWMVKIIVGVVFLLLSVVSFVFSYKCVGKLANAKAKASNLISAHPKLADYPIRSSAT